MEASDRNWLKSNSLINHDDLLLPKNKKQAYNKKSGQNLFPSICHSNLNLWLRFEFFHQRVLLELSTRMCPLREDRLYVFNDTFTMLTVYVALLLLFPNKKHVYKNKSIWITISVILELKLLMQCLSQKADE